MKTILCDLPHWRQLFGPHVRFERATGPPNWPMAYFNRFLFFSMKKITISTEKSIKCFLIHKSRNACMTELEKVVLFSNNFFSRDKNDHRLPIKANRTEKSNSIRNMFSVVCMCSRVFRVNVMLSIPLIHTHFLYTLGNVVVLLTLRFFSLLRCSFANQNFTAR